MSASQKHETKLSSLEKEQPGPSYLHLVKLFVKLAVGLFLFGVFAAEKICESDLADLVEVSYIFLLVESGVLIVFLIGKYFPNCCLTFVSYYLLAFMLLDLIADLFYIIWGIYFVFEFVDEDECHDQSSLSYAAKVVTLIYWVVFGFFVICGCGSKACMTFGTCCTAADTPSNSLSEKLLSKDEKTEPTTTPGKIEKVEENQKGTEKKDKKGKKDKSEKSGKKEKKNRDGSS